MAQIEGSQVRIWFSVEELPNLILNPTYLATKILDDTVNIHFHSKSRTAFTPERKKLVQALLNRTCVLFYLNQLDSDIVEAVIENTAPAVDISKFIKSIATFNFTKRYETSNFSIIPEEVRTALRENTYTDKIARAIKELDDKTLTTLIIFLFKGEAERLDLRFNRPIIQRIYTQELIRRDQILACMEYCLRESEIVYDEY